MIKKGSFVLTVFCVLFVCHAQARILPPKGAGQEGQEAVVLCERLTAHADRDEASPVVETLHYGDRIIVQDAWDGWAVCLLSETEEKTGWVMSDYLAMDPAWYWTDQETPIYALNDYMGPKVALLEAGEMLPILREEGRWLAVSMRGGTGWIIKTARDDVSEETMESVSGLHDIVRAHIKTPGGEKELTDPAGLRWIEENFSIAQPIGSAGCPFDATLTLYCADGEAVAYRIATDSCRTFITEDGTYFAYGDGEAMLKAYGSAGMIAEQFWRLFDIDPSKFYVYGE